MFVAYLGILDIEVDYRKYVSPWQRTGSVLEGTFGYIHRAYELNVSGGSKEHMFFMLGAAN